MGERPERRRGYTKGSLYEWLKENKHDWEQNIGKVIDEENVLYQTGLHPEKGDRSEEHTSELQSLQ